MKSRQIPYGLRAAVKENLDEMVREGVLQPVPTSSWATPIVTVIKPNGQPRICGDYRLTVNPLLQQTATTTLDVDAMFQGLHGNRFFSKIDLSNAFLQIPLNEASGQLTTINTMWGLYRYSYLPFGLNVSPGVFQGAINSILSGVPGVRAYQDDIIVVGTTRAEHQDNLLQLLRALDRYNVKINIKKSVFQVTQLKYLGYIITGDGISADLDRIQALRRAPRPTTCEQLRSFLGFAQYYAKFMPNFSRHAQPLYDLLADEFFTWTDELDQVYDSLLSSLLDSKVLKSFRVGIPTELVVDASEHALGAVLEQENHPIVCISRKLSPAERNYSQVQKEALAIHWATERLHKYLYGSRFRIVTDHKALQYLLHPSASLSKPTSAMIQRWAFQLSAYQYEIVHRPGKDIPQADYLSRGALKEEASDTADTTILLTNPLPVTRNKLLEETRLAYGPVAAGLRSGWSTTARRRFPDLYSRRNELHLQADGAILYNDRNLVPPACRYEVLQHLHSGHIGRDKMVSLSRYLCWWPTINRDIISYLKQCERCRTKPRTHPNWTPWPVTYQPMQRLHADYCGPFLGRYWALVVEDAFSKFPEVFFTSNPTAAFTKQALQRLFAREGVAQVLVTDNGTHFTQRDLQAWLRSIGCHPVYTAPRHPQSNGQAENFVKSLKTAVQAASPATYEELQTSADSFLLQYRNAAHATTKKSPALLFKGRHLRSSMALDTTEVTFFRGNESRPCEGLVLKRLGNRMFSILDKDDGTLHRRHKDQVTLSPTPQDDPPQPASPPPTPQAPQPPPSPKPHGSTQPKTASPGPPPPSPQPAPSAPSPPPSPVVRRSTRTRRLPSKYQDFQLTERSCDSDLP
jgi:transposase InsO family protein